MRPKRSKEKERQLDFVSYEKRNTKRFARGKQIVFSRKKVTRIIKTNNSYSTRMLLNEKG